MTFLIYLLIYISFLDLFAQLPITSIYAQNLGAATGFIGYIVGVYSLSNLLSNLFSGQLVDKNGPKKVLVGGFLMNAIILFMYSIVQTPMQLLIIRFLNGLSVGVITPAAFTYLTLYNKKKKTGRTMAHSGAAVGIAAISGPAFSGIISARMGQEFVYMVVAFLMVLGLILSFILKPIVKDTVDSFEEKPSLQGFIELFKIKGLLIGLIGGITLAASQGILAYMLPLKVVELGIADHMSAMLVSIFGIVAILFFLLPTNHVYDKFHNEYILPIGLLVAALSDALTSFATSLPNLIISISIYGIGFALLFPSMTSLIAKYSPPEIRGRAFGLFYASFSLGSFLGSAITGSFSLTPSGGFRSAAILLSIIGIITLYSARKLITFRNGK